MKNSCAKHHLTYIGKLCPLCEKERIRSFKVTVPSKPIVGQAEREQYYSEYAPSPTISESDMEALLMLKFGNVSKLK